MNELADATGRPLLETVRIVSLSESGGVPVQTLKSTQAMSEAMRGAAKVSGPAQPGL